MSRTCRCGGRLVPTWYSSGNPNGAYATFRCTGCGVIRKQKKRQPKPKDTD